MKIRFELNSRQDKEDIITFDFSRIVNWRGYEDEVLNKLTTPQGLNEFATYIINTPQEEWEVYVESSDEDGEPIFKYTKENYNILFSVTYYREWKNQDRKYQLFIEGIQKEFARC